MIERIREWGTILFSRGRVAGVVLLLVPLFALFAYHYAQDTTSFNSDHLYTVHFCDDLLHGRDMRGWHLPAAPYVVPDMVLVCLCLTLTSNVTAVFFLYAALYYSLLLAVLTALIRGTGLGRRESFLSAGLGLALLLATHTDPAFVSRSLPMFHPGNHMGALLAGLGATALVMRALKSGYGWRLAGLLVAVCTLCGFSDQLLLVQFLAPIGAVALLLGLCRLVSVRRSLLTLALLLISAYLAINGRIVLVKLGLVPMRITSLDAEPFADVAGMAERFAANLWSVADDQPPMWVAFVLHMAFAALAAAVWVRRRAPAEPVATEGAKPDPAAVVFVSLVLLLAPLSNAATLIVTNTVEPAALLRYLYTWWLLPFLCLALWPYLLPWRPMRLLPWAVVAFVAFRVATFPDALSADRFAHRYTPLARTLDELTQKHGRMRGFAEYWRARELRYLTRERVEVVPVLTSCTPWFHGFNPNAFLSADPRDLSIPEYQFVILCRDKEGGPSPEQVLARYGEPAEIIPVDQHEIWRYERMAGRQLDLFLRAQLAQRLVRNKPYVVPSEPAALRKPKANLTPWEARGNVQLPRGESLHVRFDRPVTGAMINLSAHYPDEYTLLFLRAGRELGTTRVPSVEWTGAEIAYGKPGLQSRLVPVPSACRPEGFDEVRVIPRGRPEHFILGHLLVFDEWIPYQSGSGRNPERHHRYEGEQMSHVDSAEVATVADPSASAGQARRAGSGVEGCIAYGPYTPLPAGRYRVDFALRVADNASSDVVATIDACAYGGQEILQSRPLRGDDLPAPGKYGLCPLVFDREEDLELVEFRVTVHGKAEVTLDYIDVTRVGESRVAAGR